MPPRSTWALPRRLETENSAECPCPVPCASLRDGIALRRSCVASLPSPLRHFPCGPSRGIPPAAPARCRHDCSRSSAISAAPRTGPSPAPMRRSVPPIVPDRTPAARPSPLSLRASQPLPSRHHPVHQFGWHHEPLHHSFAVHVGRHTRILQGPPGNLFFRKPRRHAHSPAHPPVDLHHNLDFFFARQLRIELRP